MALWSVPHATLLLLPHPGIFQARLLWGMELLPSWDSLPDPIPSLYIITVCQAGLSVLYNNFTLASWTSQVAQW